MENPRLCLTMNFIARTLERIQSPAVTNYNNAGTKIKPRTILEEHTVEELINLREKVDEAQKIIDRTTELKGKKTFQLVLDEMEKDRRALLVIFQTKEDKDPPPIPEGTVVIAY